MGQSSLKLEYLSEINKRQVEKEKYPNRYVHVKNRQF